MKHGTKLIDPRMLDYEILKGLYVECGMSINEIAEKQGAHPGSVYNKLRQGTLKRGGTWPLRPPNPPEKRNSLVPACGALDYVKELKEQGITYVAVARRAGISETTLRHHLRKNPPYQKMERGTVKKIMRAVEYFEAKLAEADEDEAA